MRNGEDYAEALRLAHPNTNIGTKHVTTKSTKNTATRQHVPLQARANMVSWEQHPTKAIMDTRVLRTSKTPCFTD